MTLLVRLSLFLGIAFAAIASVLAIAHHANERNLQALREQRRDEAAAFLERAIPLQSVGLETLVSSYAWWDEMVEYVRQPDPAWPSKNVDNIVGVPNGGDAIWVLNREFEPLHRIDVDYGRPPLPFNTAAELRQHIGSRYQFSFFAWMDGELWHLFGAAIQDPQFWRHETPVEGFLLLGKRWDQTWLARLGALTQTQLQVAPTAAAAALGDRRFAQELTGLNQRPVAVVIAQVPSGAVDDVRESLRLHLLAVSGGLLLLTLLAAAALAYLVLRPLNQIIRSLESRNPGPLAHLLQSRSPFGEIARLLASYFRQNRMLQEEIRRQHAVAPPELQVRDDEATEALRVRLASDLHDGPLQSIYAAGLKLGALESRLTAGRAVSPAELEAIRIILSECTTNLRNLLFDLEPEELRNQDLETALERLERHMRSVAGEFELTIAEHALDGLAREPQLHLFYICRELASNAARHARPSRASLSFRRRDGFLHLEWTNDGVAPVRAPGTGNGLRNIDQRVSRLEGSWRHHLHRGRIWTVTIEVPYTSLIGAGAFDDAAEAE